MKRLKTAHIPNMKELLYKTKQHRIEAYISNLIDGMDMVELSGIKFYSIDNKIIFKVTSNVTNVYINSMSREKILKDIITVDNKSDIEDIFTNVIHTKFNPKKMFFYNR